MMSAGTIVLNKKSNRRKIKLRLDITFEDMFPSFILLCLVTLFGPIQRVFYRPNTARFRPPFPGSRQLQECLLAMDCDTRPTPGGGYVQATSAAALERHPKRAPGVG